jgi:ferredoxin
MEDIMTEKKQELSIKYHEAAQAVINAGIVPFPLTETMIEILKMYLEEEDLDFIIAFKTKASMTMDQLKEKTGLSGEEIDRKAARLARIGFIFNQPASSGIMVYRLLPLIIVGVFEYTYMKKLPEGPGELEKLQRLAALYDRLMLELADRMQENYDKLLPFIENMPPVDRTIPILKTAEGVPVEVLINRDARGEEHILPAQSVEEIINKFDDIAVGNCFCRQYRNMLDDHCKMDAPMEVCFTFGKSARHVVNQGFARKVTREEALRILQATEEAGLVHKAFHNSSNINKEENSICNCCKCCCDTFNLWRMGATPMVNSTNYLSRIDADVCTGCGICVERCPVDAITYDEDGKAAVNEKLCIGCGICARFCPVNAVKLIEGMRKVCSPPARRAPGGR